MAVLSIFNEIFKKSVVFVSERDTSYNIFQKISRTKLILIHENVPDIVTNR